MSDEIAHKLKSFDSAYVVVNYPHTLELVALVYGILKAGKIYVPLDYYGVLDEEKRKLAKFSDYIYVSDTDSDLDLTKIFLLEAKPYFEYQRNELAYILHTSGSTGNPKGVCVSRENLNYILKACQKMAPVEANDCYLFSTRNTFDVSLTEMFSFLFNGASAYVLAVKNNNFYKLLPAIVNKYHLTHLALSPSVLKVLLKYTVEADLKNLNKLKYIMVAGEEFPLTLLKEGRALLPKVKLINAYGPTEATIYALAYDTSEIKDLSALKTVPIGRPLLGADYKIVAGELWLSGAGVSVGYFANTAKTKAAYVTEAGIRYYKTGDLVKKEGDIVLFGGRKDDQVQIHGIRVELGDVRASIARILDDKRQLEVRYYNQQLILFYTGEEIAGLHELLAQQMVSYKVPAKIIHVDHFALTASGKVNNKVLQKLASQHETSAPKVPKASVKNIVEDILQVKVSDETNLLDMGLDSLKGMEIILELEKNFAGNFDEINFYQTHTVAQLRQYIKDQNVAQKNLAEKILLTNQKPQGKVLYRYPAYFYALIYQHEKFNSQLTGKINLGKQSYEEVYHRLDKIEVLHAFRSSDGKFFEVRDCPLNINKIRSDDLELDVAASLQDLVWQNSLHNHFLYKLLYVTDGQKAVLYYSFDHAIADAKSIDILKQYLASAIAVSRPYSQYLTFVKQHNTKQLVTAQMEHFKAQNKQLKEKLKQVNPQPALVKLDYLKTDTINIYARILYYLRENLLHDKDEAKVNLIYNLRNYGSKNDFSTVMGDLHTGLTYVLKAQGDILAEIKQLINFYHNNCFNPKAYGYSTYPQLDTTQKQVVDIFDNDVDISLDYLGVVSKQRFAEIWAQRQNIQAEIQKINAHKLNVTAYVVEHQLALIFSRQVV